MKTQVQMPSRYTALLQGQPKSDRESLSKVMFDTVTIYEFPVEIGDNPACREGCPVRLGDNVVSKSKMYVDLYEKERGDRPPSKELYVDVSERAGL